MPSKTQDKRKARAAINSVTALVLLNAMIFQEVLSKKNSRVRSLQAFRDEGDPVSAFADHWSFILAKINYHPIFFVAHKLLRCLSADPLVTSAMKQFLNAARRIVDWRASLRHDLAGRLYHRLLADAKYLGAYYTSIPSSVLLLKLAIRPDRWDVDWSDLESVGQLRIADLACGTGTLLMASSDAVIDNYVRACASQRKAPDINDLNSKLVESVLYGFDVLPSAVHLTASTLSLRVPEIPINVTNLRSLKLGGAALNLGSLEFLESDETTTPSLFTVIERVRGKRGDESEGIVSIPPLDLCVMNPPFTSSRQPNLLFGTIPAKARAKMQKRLRDLVREKRIPASITAGLGSLFVALADRHIKPGGRLALVLPRALLSGVAWGKTRQLINKGYDLEYIMVCHEPGHWNFSENTDLSETMVVARRRDRPGARRSQGAVCVNLWRQPRSMVEALSLAGRLRDDRVPDVSEGPGTFDIVIGSEKFGEAISVQAHHLGSDSWHFPCAFAQTDLIRAAMELVEGRLYLPGQGVCGAVKLIALGEICKLGPDPRDVYDGFDLSAGTTPYPALWGHDAAKVVTLAQTPNAYLRALETPRPGRPLRRALDLWPRSGRVAIAQRVWLNTKSLTAVRLSKDVLSDVWWPVRLKDALAEADEKALVLWMNSTLGLLMLLAHREETRGAWIQYKKPVLQRMPVIDLTEISPRRRNALASAFDDFASLKFSAFPKIASDSARRRVDETIAKILDLPDLTPLRETLAREPIFSLSMEGLVGSRSYPTGDVLGRLVAEPHEDC